MFSRTILTISVLLITGSRCTHDYNNMYHNYPMAPSDLKVQVLSSTSVQLYWTDNSDNEDGFYIECGTSSGVYDSIHSDGPNVTSFIDADLQPNTTYYYVVKSFRSNDLWSKFSNEVMCTTPN